MVVIENKMSFSYESQLCAIMGLENVVHVIKRLIAFNHALLLPLRIKLLTEQSYETKLI